MKKKKGKNVKSEKQQKDKVRPHSESGLDDLQHEELSGHDRESSLEVSSTDEDEDEGLGDGNIGRSKNNILDK
jgi:hypothetical protein